MLDVNKMTTEMTSYLVISDKQLFIVRQLRTNSITPHFSNYPQSSGVTRMAYCTRGRAALIVPRV